MITNISPYKACEHRVADEIRHLAACGFGCIQITVEVTYPASDSLFPGVFYYTAKDLGYLNNESFEIDRAIIDNQYTPRPKIPFECKKSCIRWELPTRRRDTNG